MQRAVKIAEHVLLTISVVLLIFLYIYVYGFGKIRGPLARKEFYKRGNISEREAEVRDQESAFSVETGVGAGKKMLKFVEPEAETEH